MQAAPPFSLCCAIICLWGKVKPTNCAEPWPSPSKTNQCHQADRLKEKSSSTFITARSFSSFQCAQGCVVNNHLCNTAVTAASAGQPCSNTRGHSSAALSMQGHVLAPVRGTCVGSREKMENSWEEPAKLRRQHMIQLPRQQQGSSCSAKLCTATISGPFSTSCGWRCKCWKHSFQVAES